MCGSEYKVKATIHERSIYCSEKCRDVIRRKKQNGNRYKYIRNYYNANYIDFDTEDIEYDKVFIDNGYVCHLCGEPIDRTIKWPDRMSASIDHVVPISKGGSHTYSNLKPAHFVCNVRKGNNINYIPGASPS